MRRSGSSFGCRRRDDEPDIGSDWKSGGPTRASMKRGTSVSLSDTFSPRQNCFIATAAYDTPLEPRIDVLRAWRDAALLSNKAGQKFVELYYACGPNLAKMVSGNSELKQFVRKGLDHFINFYHALKK